MNKSIRNETDCLHVLLVSTKSDLSGAPLHVFELAKGLHNQGLAVSAVFGEIGDVNKLLEDEGISTYVNPSIKSSISPLLDMRAVRDLSRLVRSLNPDIIHAHSSKAGMIARIVAWRHSIPVVFTIHGWGFGPGRKKLISLYVRIVEWLLKSITTRYIAVSEADSQLGIESLGIPVLKMTCIHNGVPDAGRPVQVNPGSTLIMVARNDHQKDYETLIKAIKSLPVKLRCVGRGTDTAGFKKMAADAIGDESAKLDFMGASSDVAGLLDSSNIFVLSSRFEGLPLSIIEAMRAGLPVICSDVGGCSELVENGKNGFLVKAGDINAFHHAINQLISDHDLQKSMGVSGRNIYEMNFASGKMITKTIDVYRKIIN